MTLSLHKMVLAIKFLCSRGIPECFLMRSWVSEASVITERCAHFLYSSVSTNAETIRNISCFFVFLPGWLVVDLRISTWYLILQLVFQINTLSLLHILCLQLHANWFDLIWIKCEAVMLLLLAIKIMEVNRR